MPKPKDWFPWLSTDISVTPLTKTRIKKLSDKEFMGIISDWVISHIESGYPLCDNFGMIIQTELERRAK